MLVVEGNKIKGQIWNTSKPVINVTETLDGTIDNNKYLHDVSNGETKVINVNSSSGYLSVKYNRMSCRGVTSANAITATTGTPGRLNRGNNLYSYTTLNQDFVVI